MLLKKNFIISNIIIIIASIPNIIASISFIIVSIPMVIENHWFLLKIVKINTWLSLRLIFNN